MLQLQVITELQFDKIPNYLTIKILCLKKENVEIKMIFKCGRTEERQNERKKGLKDERKKGRKEEKKEI